MLLLSHAVFHPSSSKELSKCVPTQIVLRKSSGCYIKLFRGHSKMTSPW